MPAYPHNLRSGITQRTTLFITCDHCGTQHERDVSDWSNDVVDEFNRDKAEEGWRPGIRRDGDNLVFMTLCPKCFPIVKASKQLLSQDDWSKE